MEKEVQVIIKQETYPELYEDIIKVNSRGRAERIRCLASLFCDFKSFNAIKIDISRLSKKNHKADDENNSIRDIRSRILLKENKDKALFNELSELDDLDKGEIIKRYASGWLMITGNGISISIGRPEEEKSVVDTDKGVGKKHRAGFLKQFTS